MKSPSNLEPAAAPVFLDTSVLINLLASGRIHAFAKALGRRLVVEKTVVDELKRDPVTKQDGRAILRQLESDGVLEIIVMDDRQAARFLDLVAAPAPDDLDDGEAATIACAAGAGAVGMDEAKGRRIAARDFPAVLQHSSLDIMCSEPVLAKMAGRDLRQALRQAKEIGRMRIPPAWRPWWGSFVDAHAAELSAVNPATHVAAVIRPVP